MIHQHFMKSNTLTQNVQQTIYHTKGSAERSTFLHLMN